MNSLSAGAKFRKALEEKKPLQIVGTINAYCAMLAEDAGHSAIYLSGGGVANARGNGERPRLGAARRARPRRGSPGTARLCLPGRASGQWQTRLAAFSAWPLEHEHRPLLPATRIDTSGQRHATGILLGITVAHLA